MDSTAHSTPWLIARTDYRTIAQTSFDIIALPWGATESHGYHLPYATDNIEIESIAAESARIAWTVGARVAILPTIPFGVQTGQLDLPFCINLNPSTQAAILHDILASLSPTGVKKFVLLNGHGGNDFRQILRELQPRHPGLFLSTLSWFGVDSGQSIFDIVGDHADERETSLMLHLCPDLVGPKERWGDGSTNDWTIAGLREKWAWAPREWTRATNDTGAGDPRAATAEKGARYFESITNRIANYFVDLANTSVDALYAPRPTA